MGKVVILGATGMLGSAVFAQAEQRGFDVIGTTTSLAHVPKYFRSPMVEFRGSQLELEAVVEHLSEDDWVINCVGLIKHHIDETNLDTRRRAIDLNAVLPHSLDALARQRGFRVVQIATDCVYSGSRGSYAESDPFDASDVYGQTKALGEVPSPNVMHVRASIIGRELRSHRSLIDWAILQAEGAEINGFSDHYWNGVTTLAFARIALGMTETDVWTAGTKHLVPADSVSKLELLSNVLTAFDRNDIHLSATTTAKPIDRTLVTEDTRVNRDLWSAGGYDSPPTIEAMVQELAQTQGTLS